MRATVPILTHRCLSQLPCGLNGAVYFSQMDADGGMARFPTNKAGAKYGTGKLNLVNPSQTFRLSDLIYYLFKVIAILNVPET